MKRVALGLLLAALAAGCGSSGGLPTHLTLSALNPNVGEAVFHVDCGGRGVAQPAAAKSTTTACDALRSNPSLITAPQPYTCLGGPSSWFDVTISGRLAGKPVFQKFSTCWTPQMPTLGKLGLFKSLERHVLPRRHGVVLPGIRRTFPPGALRPGDLLTCTVGGHELELGVSDRVGSLGDTGFGGRVNVTLAATRHGDGSVVARCGRTNSR